MILVDSSVWIDYFNGTESATVDYLNHCLGTKPLAMGDLILAEVLQGFRFDKHLNIAKELFSVLPIYDLAGKNIALKSAENYRALRAKGITVRKTVDCIIATYCIENHLPLLHADKDFEGFHVHLTLQRALQIT